MAHAMTHPADAMTGVAFVAPARSRTAPTVRTYRRRRLAVLLAAIATFLVGPMAASRAVAAFRDVPASVPERRPAPATPSVETGGYVVQPGDTLWSIARRLQPEGDVRALVHQLVAVNGGAALGVGQRLVLP